MANKTNCIKNGIPYYRIRRTVGKKQNKQGFWVDDVKEFYGKNKKDAEAKYDEYKQRRLAGLSGENRCFGELADFFVYQVFMQNSSFAAGTKERYEQVYKSYVKGSEFAGFPVENIRSNDLQKFYNDLNCSNATLKAINNVLRHFYKYLEKEGYCRDITGSLVLPKKAGQRKKTEKANEGVIVWTDDEVRKIADNLGDNRIRLIIVLALNTGCRISELLGLQYSDIRDGKIYINKQLGSEAVITVDEKKIKEFKLTETKTKNSVRSMPLSPEVLDEVERHKSWHEKEILENGYKTDAIFTTRTGKYCDRHNIDRACRRYYKTIDVEYKGIHTYRRTFCTNLCRQGVPLQTACKLMGHTNINVTAQFYTNIDDEQKQEAINKITGITF